MLMSFKIILEVIRFLLDFSSLVHGCAKTSNSYAQECIQKPELLFLRPNKHRALASYTTWKWNRIEKSKYNWTYEQREIIDCTSIILLRSNMMTTTDASKKTNAWRTRGEKENWYLHLPSILHFSWFHNHSIPTYKTTQVRTVIIPTLLTMLFKHSDKIIFAKW